MAAENDSEASFLVRLMSSQNREFSIFVPLVLGVMGPSTRGDGDGDGGQNPAEDMQEGQERLVLINPITQGMIVIQGGTNLEALVREISEMESGKAVAPPASKASIEAMPTVKIDVKGSDDDGDKDCAICLEEMEEAKEMPCRHRFHSNCIEKWLGMHGSCPCCRYAMPVEEEGKKSVGAAGDEGRRREIWVSLSVSDTTNRDSTTTDAAADDQTSGDQ
ncbi:E3 ubiquitin-protein ligase MPSR1-like [Aristolochia californica]|uniref:E3 ubiquitin-protein ligase MPSR1-like n=1 Tax=Aristolochia californica TaxID=171875 RepID=UPI0035E24ABA